MNTFVLVALLYCLCWMGWLQSQTQAMHHPDSRLLRVALHSSSSDQSLHRKKKSFSLADRPKTDLVAALEKYDMQRAAADAQLICSRLPLALKQTAIQSMQSFLQSALFLIPVGLALNLRLLRGPKMLWLMEGGKVGLEWAKMGAAYSGAETFCQHIRNKNDRLNAYVGSGISSAIVRLHEGPMGVTKGFLIGFAFMYAIDMVVGPVPRGTSLSSSSTLTGRLT